MTRTDRKNLSILLILVMLLMWFSHQFSQTVVVHAASEYSMDVGTADAHSHDHNHSHDEQPNHQVAGIEHQHLSGSPDHTHDSVQLPAEIAQPSHLIRTRPDRVHISLPTSPLYLIDKPPRSHS